MCATAPILIAPQPASLPRPLPVYAPPSFTSLRRCDCAADGPDGSGEQIPGGSTLQFDVELLEIQKEWTKKQEAKKQRAREKEAKKRKKKKKKGKKKKTQGLEDALPFDMGDIMGQGGSKDEV